MSGPAELLRGVGYVWTVLSLIGAAMVAFGMFPGGWPTGVVMALQGFLLGIGAVVVAERGERIPA